MADEHTEESDASEEAESTESTESEDTEHSHYEEELKKFPDKEKAADAWKERQQKKREEPEEEDVSDEDERISRVAERIADRKIADLQKKLTRSQVENQIRSMTSSEIEASVALKYLDNVLIASGDPAEDAKRAVLLANSGKLYQENEVLKKSLVARQNRVTSFASSKKKQDSPRKEPSIAEGDRKMLEGGNFKWNPSMQHYEAENRALKPVNGDWVSFKKKKEGGWERE